MKIDARGKQCPLPVIETKEALTKATPGEIVEVRVDNEIAVQNLYKLAVQKNLSFASEKSAERDYLVKITASGEAAVTQKEDDFQVVCYSGNGTVVTITSETMGVGDDVLGKLLMKGFIFALTKQETPPATVLLYNGGARLSCEGSESLEDLKNLEACGVTILTCGTCLNHYGLSEKLSVGTVTNMYDIAERLSRASLIIRP